MENVLLEREGHLATVTINRPKKLNALDDRTLTISGETGDHPPTGYTLTHEEFRPAHFERAFTLANAYDDEEVQAAMNDGVLTLSIAKTPKRKARSIPVKRG